VSRTGPGPAVDAGRSLIRLRIAGHRGLALAAVAAAGPGGLVHALWAPFGLGPGGAALDAPFPGLWRWFFALGLPGLFLAFTAVHAWLIGETGPGERAAAATRAAWRRDRASSATAVAVSWGVGLQGRVGSSPSPSPPAGRGTGNIASFDASLRRADGLASRRSLIGQLGQLTP